MHKDSDIDYFIITEPGRLWICRSLLIAFKKIFLLNSYKFFCLNYFVDSQSMKIDDINIYTAHEIKTLLPTYGKEYCEQFFNSNRWTSQFLPNLSIAGTGGIPPSRIRGVKRFIEWCLTGTISDRLENKLRRISQSYWKSKFRHLDAEKLSEVNICSEHISAYHPENFKKIVLNKYQLILKELEKEHNYSFS